MRPGGQDQTPCLLDLSQSFSQRVLVRLWTPDRLLEGHAEIFERPPRTRVVG
jgi:hypothetical protein